MQYLGVVGLHYTVSRITSLFLFERVPDDESSSALFQTRCTQREQTSAEHGNPEDPDFGLWTPGSEA